MRHALPPSHVWIGSDRQFPNAAYSSAASASPMNTCAPIRIRDRFSTCRAWRLPSCSSCSAAYGTHAIHCLTAQQLTDRGLHSRMKRMACTDCVHGSQRAPLRTRSPCARRETRARPAGADSCGAAPEAPLLAAPPCDAQLPVQPAPFHKPVTSSGGSGSSTSCGTFASATPRQNVGRHHLL